MAMARQLGIDNAADSPSCTICHDPMRQVPAARFAGTEGEGGRDQGVSCANCHGPAEKWLLSHTRPDYPKDALAKLGMRPLDSPYQRANHCVACHQNLGDELVGTIHPPLVFELDGLLEAQPRHWREEPGFSRVQTWLVGQAVALREVAAQAGRQPSGARDAEIEAIGVLLGATGTGWEAAPDGGQVAGADNYAKRIAGKPITPEEGRAILMRLIDHREPFEKGAFGGLEEDFRRRAQGHYAERLALAIDRLSQSLASSGGRAVIANKAINDLFDAAGPPESFDAEAVNAFVAKLDAVSASFLGAD